MFKEISNTLQNPLKKFKTFLKNQVGQFDSSIKVIAKDAIANEGKLIRPMLLLSFASLGENEEENEKILSAAAIMELVHTSTLIHDDIIDGAKTRRNFPTLNAKYGSHAAVLFGDALLAHSMYLSFEIDNSQINKLIVLSVKSVCQGEIAQTLKKSKVTIETYFDMIERKTSELFKLSCQVGAILENKDDAYCQDAGLFGNLFGRAFQIYDDLEDILGSEKEMGKTLGTDYLNGKCTLPVLLYLEKLPKKEQSTLFNDLICGKEDIKDFTKKLKSSGALLQTYDYFLKECKSAYALAEKLQNPIIVDFIKSLDLKTSKLLKDNNIL